MWNSGMHGHFVALGLPESPTEFSPLLHQKKEKTMVSLSSKS